MAADLVIDKASLAYAFQMAEWRLERANNHIGHLKQIIEWIVHPEHYATILEKDGSSGYYLVKIGPKAGALPHHLPVVMGEIVHNLSITLDYLWSGFSRQISPSDTRAHFPRHETRANLADMLSKSPIIKAIPNMEPFISDCIKPYKDGNPNPLVWTIGKLDNIDKHRLLLSSMVIAKLGKFVATSEDGSVIDLSYGTINSEGPSLTLGFTAPCKLNDDTELTADVAFNEPSLIPPGKPVLEIMGNLSQATAEVIAAFKTTFL